MEEREKKERERQTSIALTSNDEGAVLVFGILVDPLVQELVVTISGRLVSVLNEGTFVSGPVRETNKGRSLNIQNVGQLVPVSREVAQVAALGGAEGAVLLEQTQQTGAPRSTIHPHHQRLVVSVSLGFDQPVEELPSIVKRDVPTAIKKIKQ